MVGTHKTEHAKQNRYGLISMIGIIVGTVIGSGIYIKNEQLIGDTNSALYATIGWIIGGLIVLAMLVAFMEITSITSRKNKQGTFASWSRSLWGEKTSRFIGGYFTLFYFPLVIAAETIFAAEQIFKIDDTGTWFGSSDAGQIGGFIVFTIVAIVFLLVAYLFVLIFTNSGKKAQITGTVIKVIPLVTIIFLAAIVSFGWVIDQPVTFAGNFDGQPNEIFNPSDDINQYHSNAVSILLIMPAILFAFDGFLFASSMSTEAKKPSTYKTAAVASIFIITTLYILFSLSTFILADVTLIYNDSGEIVGIDETAFGINAIFHNLFNDNVADILGAITLLIIAISILTATLGYGISSMWTVSDSSNIEEIYDSKSEFIKRNRSGIPIGAGVFILRRSILMLLLMRTFDLIGLIILIIADGNYNYYYTGMTNYFTDLFTLFNFTIYAIIILGGIKNRFTNHVEVDRVKGFMPFAFFALIAMVLIVGVFAVDIVYSLVESFSSSEPGSTGISTLEILAIVTFFAIYFYYIIKNNLKLNKIDEAYIVRKKIYKKAYDEHLMVEEYVENNNINIDEQGISENDLYTIDEKIRHWWNDKFNKDDDNGNDNDSNDTETKESKENNTS